MSQPGEHEFPACFAPIGYPTPNQRVRKLKTIGKAKAKAKDKKAAKGKSKAKKDKQPKETPDEETPDDAEPPTTGSATKTKTIDGWTGTRKRLYDWAYTWTRDYYKWKGKKKRFAMRKGREAAQAACKQWDEA